MVELGLVVGEGDHDSALGFPAVAELFVDSGFEEVEGLVHEDVVFHVGVGAGFAGGGALATVGGTGGRVGVDGDGSGGAAAAGECLCGGDAHAGAGGGGGVRGGLGFIVIDEGDCVGVVVGDGLDGADEDVAFAGFEFGVGLRGRCKDDFDVVSGIFVRSDNAESHRESFGQSFTRRGIARGRDGIVSLYKGGWMVGRKICRCALMGWERLFFYHQGTKSARYFGGLILR